MGKKTLTLHSKLRLTIETM